MFFLSDEERKKLLRFYLPKARTEGVAEELRGWNWNQAPLAPVYDCTLAIYEVANAYCGTSRDMYLRRVVGVRSKPNGAMVQGSILHALVAGILVATKRLIYLQGVENHREIIRKLNSLTPVDAMERDIVSLMESLEDTARQELDKKLELLMEFERGRVIARMQEVLVKHPYIGEDSFAALTVPLVVEQKLDGSFLGLSSHLSTDAYNIGEPMIVDLKFGEPKKFHRLTTTGYALAMEAIHEYPVNVGCLVYVSFIGDRVIVKRDIHLIDDELRQWFVETRDEKARMIFEEVDPGLANDCHESCPYISRCS